jgi:hypothetical protein
MVTFIFTNPRHHVEMMLPVARKLGEHGVSSRFLSLAELRGFESPRELAGREVVRVVPRIRRNPAAGASLGQHGGTGALARRFLQEALWYAALRPRLAWLLRGGRDVVVLPNDAAFPYGAIARMLRQQHRPFVLLQEGIRFPLPREQAEGTLYGAGGASTICAWGEASAEHFQKLTPYVRVTGTPRWDAIDPAQWSERGASLQKRLGLEQRPLLFLSNTVDDQGFCTTAEKMALFDGFLRSIEPAVQGRAIVIKLHPRENVHAFRDVAARHPTLRTHVCDREALYEVLAMGQAAIVLASTVGLEALAFGLPLGVLALPGHGHVFEYVARGAASGITLENAEHEVPRLLARGPGLTPRAREFLERHLAHRGDAARRVADELIDLRRAS